tara:strand:- start:597 stop:779 length:183 start_codon:yes stop_codon:yes gene_type:complete
MQGTSKMKVLFVIFVNLKGPNNFPGRIEYEDLEIFQDKLDSSAEKYLEIQLANGEIANED